MATRYPEIAADLRGRILAGEWQPGDRLPGYKDLTLTYSAGRGVIQMALEMLEAEGLIVVVKKSGIRVRQRPERRRVPRGTRVHRRRPVEGGYSFAATNPDDPPWVDCIPPTRGERPINPRAAELLGVEAGTPVFCRRRCRAPQGEPPFGLSESWILPEVVEAAPGVREQGPPGGYLDRIEEAGHGPLDWHEITRCRMPTKDEASALDIPDRLPVMEISRVSVSARTGGPVEVTVMVTPSDRIETVVHLERDESAVYEVLSPPGGPHSPKEP